MYVCTKFVPSIPGGQKKGIRSSATGLVDGYEPLCRYWEMNLGPQEEQKVLLTAEPSAQSPRSQPYI